MLSFIQQILIVHFMHILDLGIRDSSLKNKADERPINMWNLRYNDIFAQVILWSLENIRLH